MTTTGTLDLYVTTFVVAGAIDCPGYIQGVPHGATRFGTTDPTGAADIWASCDPATAIDGAPYCKYSTGTTSRPPCTNTLENEAPVTTLIAETPKIKTATKI